MKCSTAPNVSQSANSLIVWLTAKLHSLNVRPSVRSQDATGNATSLNAPNPNVSWYAKIPTVILNSNVVPVELEIRDYINLSPSSRKQKAIKNAAHVINNRKGENIQFLENVNRKFFKLNFWFPSTSCILVKILPILIYYKKNIYIKLSVNWLYFIKIKNLLKIVYDDF